MTWEEVATMFWKPKSAEEKAIEKKAKHNVKDVDGDLARYLYRSVGVSVDGLVEYRRVTKSERRGEAEIRHIRIFDPAEADEAGVRVTEFDDLDRRPDLVKHQCRSRLEGGDTVAFEEEPPVAVIRGEGTGGA
jgi:hypothetical protein